MKAVILDFQKEKLIREFLPGEKGKMYASPEKVIKFIYKIFLSFHDADYKCLEGQAPVFKGWTRNKEDFLRDRIKEFKEDGKSSIAYRLFILRFRTGKNFGPEYIIEFCRYKDSSAIIDEVRRLGQHCCFSLSRKRKNVYRLEIQR